MGNSQSSGKNELTYCTAKDPLLTTPRLKEIPTPVNSALEIPPVNPVYSPERSATKVMSPQRLAVEEEFKMLEIIQMQMTVQDNLNSTMQDVVEKMNGNIAQMKETSDMLGAIENGPGEIRPFRVLVETAHERWAEILPLIQEFTDLANSMLKKWSASLRSPTVDEMRNDTVTYSDQLKKLNVLHDKIIPVIQIIKEKYNAAHGRLTLLASSLKQKERALKHDRLVLIGIGCLAAFGAVLATGFLGALFLFSPAAGLVLGTAAAFSARDFYSNRLNEYHTIKAQLNSIRDCQKKLEKQEWMPEIEEIVKVIEGIVSEATYCHQRLGSRLKEREETIRVKQEIEQLKEDAIRREQERDQEREQREKDAIRREQEMEQLREEVARLKSGRN